MTLCEIVEITRCGTSLHFLITIANIGLIVFCMFILSNKKAFGTNVPKRHYPAYGYDSRAAGIV